MLGHLHAQDNSVQQYMYWPLLRYSMSATVVHFYFYSIHSTIGGHIMLYALKHTGVYCFSECYLVHHRHNSWLGVCLCIFINSLRAEYIRRNVKEYICIFIIPGHGIVAGCYDSFSWWRHQMEIFSALLALCAGNSPVTGFLWSVPQTVEQTLETQVTWDVIAPIMTSL